ncbi:MAG: ATP-binding protein [Pseudomonadota bacterium]
MNALRLMRNFRPNTLAARLFILSSLAALVGVAAVALFIVSDYRRNAEKQLSELLEANIFNMMASLQLDEKGQLMGSPRLGDGRYQNFDSGWYWQVQEIGNPIIRKSSASLADGEITIPDNAVLDSTFQRSFETNDQMEQVLTGLESQVYLGEGNNLFSFVITANKSVVDEDVANFNRRLFIILSLFALSLVLAMSLLVRIGLKPISSATRILNEVRKGNEKKIHGEYPQEIQPLIDETNALIDSNTTIVERARTQVGNLAHSLKTPLAVIQNEMNSLPKQKREIFSEQSHAMRQQIQVYLDRARISARSSTAINTTEAIPELKKLVAVLAKLNPHLNFTSNLNETDDFQFAGEAHDLQEICGNLLENAAKYANTAVSLKVFTHREEKFLIQIEDDGNGMDNAEIKTAMKRGNRIDEGKKGWGLGLSIVHDIVDEYSGQLQLSKSEIGGLRAVVELPARN